MLKHERFRFSSLKELSSAIESMGLQIPLSEDTDLLLQPVNLGGKVIPNRIVAQPMEGCDGTSGGKPGDLTFRRYKRFAAGGAGLLWFEASAVVHGGRANPGQLLISEDNLKDMKLLLASSLEEAVKKYGSDRRPYTVLQLTHSGRYSRPESAPQPVIAAKNPHLDKNLQQPPRILSDEELEELEDRFQDAAVIACETGFDAVDIKSCHRYLISELLSAHTREGRYGGSFENRTRFLLNIVDKIKTRTAGELEIAVRLNAFDAVPYPYGWGVDREDFRKYDLAEPMRLVKLLEGKGIKLINISAGNPYYNPHINRPYDTGSYIPTEHPLAGVERMLKISREIQEAVPDINIVASGLSWLREFGANVAAGGIRDGWFTLAGFGRQFFAYPDFPENIFAKGRMERKKCCITCGKCSEIMRFDGKTGCVVRDTDIYSPIYKKVSEGRQPIVDKHTAEHV